MATLKTQRPPRFRDLFCGIGGLSIGLQRSGMSPVGGIDNWAEARATFERNHPGVRFLLADIDTIGLNRIEGEFATEVGYGMKAKLLRAADYGAPTTPRCRCPACPDPTRSASAPRSPPRRG
jgi:site-specific DNA-cytosine methylase